MGKRNYVYLAGIVEKEPEFNYRSRGQDYLKTVLTVVRRSGCIDHVPITIPKRICRGKLVGKWIRVKGMMTSYNKRGEEKTHLILSVFADKYYEEIEMPFCTFYENHVALEGYICKEPYYRETPLGREITDVLIAVNRPTWKSDYIPGICWGTIARYAGTLPVGTHVRITGRIQSREYQKQISEKEYETRTAYEGSISQMEVIGSEECKDQVAGAE